MGEPETSDERQSGTCFICGYITTDARRSWKETLLLPGKSFSETPVLL